MPSDREKLETESLGAIADRMAQAEQISHAYNVAHSELMRRQTEAQLEASRAQVDAAAAAKETAIYTRSSAKYVKLSVIVLAISAGLTLLLSALGLWLQQTQH
jgi:hypothetical protein